MSTLREVSSNVDTNRRARSKQHNNSAPIATAIDIDTNVKSSNNNNVNTNSDKNTTIYPPPLQLHRPYTQAGGIPPQQVESSRVSSHRLGPNHHANHPRHHHSVQSSQGRPSSVPPTGYSDPPQTQGIVPLKGSEESAPSRLDCYLRLIPYCPRLIDDITVTYLQREREAVRSFNDGTTSNSSSPVDLYRYYASPHYLQHQPDVTPKMRVILIDWLIDVHKRFDHHRETLFLTVNIIDRYLSVVNTKYKPYCGIRRSKLQLVAVAAYLIATKYEEIIVPDLKEFVLVAAHSYTKKEVLVMESEICTALGFRFTVPTSYQFASRLLTVLENAPFVRLAEHPQRRMETLFHLTNFLLEHALLDYNALQFTPSQVGNAAVFLAVYTLQVALRNSGEEETRGGLRADEEADWGWIRPSPSAERERDEESLPSPSPPSSPERRVVWSAPLKAVSGAGVGDFLGCAEGILHYVETIKNNKYQAVRQKYASPKCAEVSKMAMPLTLPHH